MNNTRRATERPHYASLLSAVQPVQDVEQQADEFEEELAADLIRRGVIERW